MMSDADTRRSTRGRDPKRLRLSLYAMFLITLIVSIPVVWLAAEYHRQQIALSQLQHLGYDFSPHEAQSVRANVESLLQGTPYYVRGVEQVSFYPSAQTVQDDNLRYLMEFRELKVLCLADTQVTDDGLVHLIPSAELRIVYLQNTSVTDDGLALLARLPRLEYLDLRNTKITDAGITHICAYKNLNSLNLDGTSITDVGLIGLRDFTELSLVSLIDTQVSLDGVDDLRRHLPDCNILHLPPNTAQAQGSAAPNRIEAGVAGQDLVD